MRHRKTISTYILGLAAVLAFGQNWQSKLDPAVFQAAEAGQSVDCIVVLAEDADLGEAAFLPLKKDKRAYVAGQLRRVAERSQKPVVKVLQAQGSSYQPFFIVNAVRVEQADLSLLETLARLPGVDRIDPNPKVYSEAPRAEPAEGGDRAIEWGIAMINADDVWALGYDGTGVVVSGEDTGYDWDHPALINKYRGWNGSAADHNYNWHDAIHAIDPHNSGANPCGLSIKTPCDDQAHGTHTMGTMVGDDGAGNQIGVAPGAKWIGCRNMERGWGMPSTYIECFEWFCEPSDTNNANANASFAPDVINNSWACPPEEGCNPGNFSMMETAVNNLTAMGIFVVVSAGNSGANGCSSVNWPAPIFENSFTVGATNNLDSISGLSSRGPVTVDGSGRLKPNISAPGINVRSCVPGTGYANSSGTSMAGPHVVGVVALMLDANPYLTIAQLRTNLQTPAVDRTSSQHCGGANNGSMAPNNVYGYGRVDALASVNAVLLLLPIELIDFQGFAKDASVQTTWNIAPNGSLNHFELERAGNRLEWAAIQRQVFLPEKTSYGYLDPSPLAGTNYYRLKMVDIDGSIEYSKTIAVRWSGVVALNIAPNPVQDAISISANWQAGAVELDIFDFNGRLVQRATRQVETPLASLDLEVAALPAGVYFLKVIAENGAGQLLQGKFTKLGR